MKKITSAQLRAGRALVRMSAAELAAAAQIGIATIRRAEAEDGEISATVANSAAIRAALEAAGVVFLDPNGNGPGVALRKSE